MYPETLLQTLCQKLKKNWIFAFLSAFGTGLIIHLYRLTNHLLTWDSVYNFYDSQNKTALGRPFLTFTCGIGSYYDLQWVNGILSLLYLSLTCVCLVELFSLNRRTCIFFLCGLTVSFPTVAGTFSYMYTADGYFLAQLCAAMAVLLTVTYKKGFLPGLVLLALSYGSYQAYVSYAIMLILTWSILQLTGESLRLQELCRQWLRFLLMGGLGTALYFICNRLLADIQQITASDYNGISALALPDGADFILAVKNCLIDFAYFFFGPLDKINLFKVLNAGLFVLLALLFLWILYQQKLYRKPARLCLILLCLAAMPFVCSMIYFLSPQVRYYMLMYGGFCLIYMLPVLLCENLTHASERKNPERAATQALPPLFLSWSSFLLTALTVFNFALIANISYLYLTTANAKTFALVSRMTDRIEQMDHREGLKKLCIIGHFDDFDTISLNLPPALAGVRDNYIISEQAHFCAMMDTYYGISLEPCTDAEKETIHASERFRSMDCWPAASSMSWYDDIIIIKIAEN